MKILVDKLITHPTAKLAKDKGFDIPCFYAYGESEDKIYNALDFKTFNVFDNVRYFSNTNNCYIDKHDIDYYQVLYTLCPTQNTLQAWLRTIHNIDILVEKYIGGSSGVDEVYSCCVYRITGTVGDFRKELIYAYDTYEEALEAGLCTGLNLIN